MLRTDHFIRFERVSSVSETDRGIEADVHGERFRVEVCRPDVVRLRMSRGGAFDDKPTYAVCVDPLAAAVTWRAEPGEQVWRVITDELTVSVWLDPFRVDVHRADGSAVLESAADEEGRYWTYATLNDSWTTRRACGPDDAFFGLGEKGGRLDRRGRDFTMWNTDVLNEHATEEFRAGLEQADPRSDMASTEFDPYYVNIPFLYHQTNPSAAMGGSFVDNGYRGYYELSREVDFGIAFAGGQWTEYVFAGPAMPSVLEAYTWLTGRASMPPLWALGYHQCRWHAYSQDDLEAIGDRLRAEDFPCDALWLDIDYMDGYRVFTWNEDLFPDPATMLERLGEKGFKVVTIVDPGVKHDPGYAVYDDGLAREVFCRTEGGDTYIGQVWPGNTAFPDFATPEARAWWGELNAAHVESGLAGIWNDMNEPATGEIPPERNAIRPGPRVARALPQPVRAAHGDGHARGTHPCSTRRADLHPVAGRLRGDPALRRELDGRQPGAVGPPVAQRAHGVRLRAVGTALRRCRHRRLPGRQQPGALRPLDAGRHADPFCRNHSETDKADQYPWSFGPEVLAIAREAVRLRYRLMPYIHAAFEHAVATGEPVQRPLVLDHQDDPAAVAADDEYLFGRDLLVAPVFEAGRQVA